MKTRVQPKENKNASLRVGWRFLLRQFLMAWALAALLSAGWMAFNIIGGATPVWLDLVVVVALALGMFRLVRPINTALRLSRWFRIASLTYLVAIPKHRTQTFCCVACVAYLFLSDHF
jgi:hypothetical protein